MIRQVFIVSVVVLLCTAVSWSQEFPATTQATLPTGTAVEGDAQDFVFLDTTRPVFMRLHVQIDGVGFREVWRRYAEKSFDYADANNDGTLTAGEIQNASRSGLMLASPANFRDIDTSRNGRVSREEWVAWMQWSSDISFSTANQQQQQQASRVRLLGYGQPQPNPGNQLWKHLDGDQDSVLTKAELMAAGQTLRKLDLDDDEIIAADELNPYANPFANRFLFSRSRGGRVQQPSGLGLMAISSRGNRSALAQQLLARYDRPQGKVKDRKLSRKEIALEPAAFDAADADGDGYLDTEELTHMVRRPRPQVSLLVRLGEDARKLGKFALVKAAGETNPMVSSSVRLSPGGTLTVVLGTVHIQFSASDPVNATSNVKFYEAQFKAADRDNNGYLDKKEAQESPYFRSQAAQIDRDKNGDVYLNEVTAYIQQRAEITMSRIAARGTDGGKLLFDVMDANRDRRLSQRELATAPDKLPLWDRNLDGKLVAAEIPHQYSIAITRGGGGGGVAIPPPSATASSRSRPRTAPMASPMAAPAWFTKMDRNRDGDLSPREFLGGRQAFDELDANGDGLLDAREAANAG